MEAQKGDGNGGDDPDDWVARVIAEMEKGEQRARDMYESWKQCGEEDFSPNRSVESSKEDQSQEETVKGRHCKRAGAWWGRRCRQQENENICEKSSESASEHERNETVPTDQDWQQQYPARFPTPPELQNKLNEFATHVDRFFDQLPFITRELNSSLYWLLKSRYSPFWLENESGFDQTWRNRLEDLLRTQAGVDMNDSKDNQRNDQSSDLDYARRMVNLLSMIEQQRQPKSDESEDRFDQLETEEDLYTRFLGDFSTFPYQSQHQPTPSQQVPTSKPSILSTLTTTERHVAPDGTVTTKMVLKRRFADGREESEERVETSRDSNWSDRRKVEEKNLNENMPNSSVIQELRKKDESQQRRGWFWSN
jgi:hypothetical protein